MFGDDIPEPRELLAPGERFAGYVVRGVLGAGGSSEVYLADDPRESRPVSLKVLELAESRIPAVRAGFLHEFDILSAVRHPTIVRMYAHGEYGGRLWSAHEYVDGDTAAILTPAPHHNPDLSRVLAVLTDIAEGLDHIHGCGIVHLDVKPANFLVPRTGPVTAKLSDFGTARWLDRPEPPLVVDGRVVGSLPYAAPELVRGQRVSAATDQYALACSAVELLTGRPPFPEPNPTMVADAQAHKPPPDVSGRRHWIPHAVDAVLDRALAKDPAARYDSCKEPIRLIARALHDIRPVAEHRTHFRLGFHSHPW